MPTAFNESRLCFTFGDSWKQVLKYDDCSFYRSQVEPALGGTSAVDFIGLREARVFLIEAKNFRDYETENRSRIASGDLFAEVARNARDTVAAIAGAHLTGAEPQMWGPLAASLVRRRTAEVPVPLIVVLWLEGAPSASGARRGPFRGSTYRDALRRSLRWLTPYVDVCSTEGHAGIPDLTVTRLPDAP